VTSQAGILVETDVAVAMRDGVRLATDVYRPAAGSPAPVLLARTPYDKQRALAGAGVPFDIMRAVRVGYAVAVQDVRGRYASEGRFRPHFQEADDGIDTLAWAARQPWSAGVAGTFGGSYLGGTQWATARHQPAALRAMAPAVTPSDMYEGTAYQGGAHVLHGLRWAVSIAPEELQRRGQAAPELDVEATLRHLPLGDQPLLREVTPFYWDWLAHPTADDYWHPVSPCTAYNQITTPALHITGWYDIFLWPTCQNYRGMRDHGRRGQHLIIGPWTHMNFTGSFPEREFGPQAGADAIDLTGRHLRWFDHWLKDEANGVDQEEPVTIFVMGADQWRTEPDWPLPGTSYRPYYLHSGGQANSLHGDGSLSASPPASEPPDTFLYDPLRPVPSIGGQVILPGANSSGPRDQRLVETRDDVLVYSTTPLDRPVEVTVELRLFVSSSAPDTDFTGKLVDVHPDGRAIILTDGILRARYRESTHTPRLLEPGTVHEIQVNLWATSNVFLPGHHIRLEVSSSNFPRFGRNSNTGGDISSEGAGQHTPAVNRVHHDTTRPSCLVLPVIDRTENR
jgi:hypothetical protein